jgi:L-malate glycosyltransferase
LKKVLHITPHLGGGVGRALAGVARAHQQFESSWHHDFACLEIPEKTGIVKELKDLGCGFHAAPDNAKLAELIRATDVVQVEWWHHPVLFQRLCSEPLPPMRLVVWCHVNGLSTPLIPASLLQVSHRTLLTSPCTLEAENLAEILKLQPSEVGVIHSCAGFLPAVEDLRSPSGPMQAGYLGSLNFSKLNPRFIEFLAAVKLPHFSISLFGDNLNLETLSRQAHEQNCCGVFRYKGYTSKPEAVLAGINVMPYLLNPSHYGTTENALLEAMAAAVVPVVLDHPVERSLVQDKITGLVVRTPKEFGAAMKFLWENPHQRDMMGKAAAQMVREKFTLEKTSSEFDHHLNALLDRPREEVDFGKALGTSAAQWFLAGMDSPEVFLQDAPLPPADSPNRPAYHEITKGSIAHFHHYFPQDADLTRWARRLQRNPMPFFPCSVCNSSQSDSLLTLETGNLDGSPLYPEVRLVCCKSCGHVYNHISQSELDGLYEYYNEEYAPINLKVSQSSGDRPGSSDALTSTRFNQLFGYLENYLKPDHDFLDVGCAAGGFLTFLKDRGFNSLTGVDMTDNYVDQARKTTSFQIEKGLAEALPFEDDSFDFLVLEQVMEHLINPGQAFQEAGRVLRRGGFLCIGVPDAACYGDRQFFDYYWVLLREHLQHFDINHLQQLAHEEGFELLDFHQTDHQVMSERMVMPTLYGVFAWKGKGEAQPKVTGHQDDLKKSMTQYLAKEADHLEQRRLLVQQLEKDQVPVYAWGVGREFEYLHAAAGLHRCRLEGLIDLNSLKQEKHTVDGIPVSSAEILKDAPANAVLLVTAVAHTAPVMKAAEDSGFQGRIITF